MQLQEAYVKRKTDRESSSDFTSSLVHCHCDLQLPDDGQNQVWNRDHASAADMSLQPVDEIWHDFCKKHMSHCSTVADPLRTTCPSQNCQVVMKQRSDAWDPKALQAEREAVLREIDQVYTKILSRFGLTGAENAAEDVAKRVALESTHLSVVPKYNIFYSTADLCSGKMDFAQCLSCAAENASRYKLWHEIAMTGHGGALRLMRDHYDQRVEAEQTAE